MSVIRLNGRLKHRSVVVGSAVCRREILSSNSITDTNFRAVVSFIGSSYDELQCVKNLVASIVKVAIDRDFLSFLTNFSSEKIFYSAYTRTQTDAARVFENNWRVKTQGESVGVTWDKQAEGKSRWPTTRVISKQQRGYRGSAN